MTAILIEYDGFSVEARKFDELHMAYDFLKDIVYENEGDLPERFLSLINIQDDGLLKITQYDDLEYELKDWYSDILKEKCPEKDQA